MKRLVFVDDNPDFLDLLSQEFEGEDYEVVPILDQMNKNLVQEITALEPTVLFLDIYLVSTTLEDLVEKLRASDATKDIPIYLISFTEQAEVEQIAEAIQVKGALTKPVTKQTIQQVLRELPL